MHAGRDYLHTVCVMHVVFTVDLAFTPCVLVFFYTVPATPYIYTLSLHDALPISSCSLRSRDRERSLAGRPPSSGTRPARRTARSEEHTSELQSRGHLVCRLLLEKKKKTYPVHLD